MTLATATSQLAQASVRRRLSVRGPRIFVSSFSQPGLDLRIGHNFTGGRGSETVLTVVDHRTGSSNVVCYVDGGTARGITSVLLRRNVATVPCRTNLPPRRHSGTRGGFVRSHIRIIYTAVTFNVNVSGSGMHFMVRCGLPGDVRTFCRRVKHTNQSKLPSRAMLFCSLNSLIRLSHFTRSDNRGRVGVRGLQHVRRCTRSSMYQQHVLLGCFDRRSSYRYGGYSMYGGPPGHFSKAVLTRGTLDTVVETRRRVDMEAIISVLQKAFSPRIAGERFRAVGAFKIKHSIPKHS